VTHAQTEALGALVAALTRLFQEAVDLLPRMITAQQTGTLFPSRDPALLADAVAALIFRDEDGLTKFLTLAHIDRIDAQNRIINYQEQETLVRLALDARTCSLIEDAAIPGLTSAPGPAPGMTSNSMRSPDAAFLNHCRIVLFRYTQNVALRATFLANYLRFAMEYISLCPQPVLSVPFDNAVLQRHVALWQDDVARLSPFLADRKEADRILASSLWHWPPLILASVYNPDCPTLGGVPVSRAHKTAWTEASAPLQEGTAHAAPTR